MKKNCDNCKHLEYVEAEYWDDNGFTCHKRNNGSLSQGKESELLFKLDNEKYRHVSKVCFEGEEPLPSPPKD